MRLHSGVARSHERRQRGPPAGVGEADVVGKGVDRQHSRVEKSDGGGDSSRLDQPHVPCPHVRRDGPPYNHVVSVRTQAPPGGVVLTFKRFGLHQREGVQREQLERLGKYELQ